MPRLLVFGALMVAVAIIGEVDVLTGPAYGMSLFYLVPVAATGWHVGRRHGLFAAGAAALLWYSAELSARGTGMILATTWNGFSRLVIFGGAAWLLAKLHQEREIERDLRAQAESLARTDPLTGLANSRAFLERLREEAPRLQRRQASIVIAYIDLDRFKAVNDQHGHDAGDQLLRDVAARLRAVVRAGDLTARLGGDEFAVALWDTDLDGGRKFVERCRGAMSEAAAGFANLGLGASIGLSLLSPGGDVEEALRTADAAMYNTKQSRRSSRPSA